MRPPKAQVIWGLLGAAAAAWFAIWMLFFPQFVAGYFAWDVHPRAARRSSAPATSSGRSSSSTPPARATGSACAGSCTGNLVFTGTLLFGTYWHLDEFHWNPLETPLAHIWIVLYIFEPITMLYLVPRGIAPRRRRPCPAARSTRGSRRS